MRLRVHAPRREAGGSSWVPRGDLEDSAAQRKPLRIPVLGAGQLTRWLEREPRTLSLHRAQDSRVRASGSLWRPEAAV